MDSVPPPPPPPRTTDSLMSELARDISQAEKLAVHRAPEEDVPRPREKPAEDDYDDDDGYDDYDDEEYTDEEYYSEEYSDEYSDYTDEEEGVEDGGGGGRRSRRRGGRGGAPVVELPNRPLPVDVWRAQHETDDTGKAPLALDHKEWDDLVERLNDSSRRKQIYLMRAQQKQIADELAGLSFAPRICKKSKELAAHNKNLADRMANLMSIRERKMLRVRDERNAEELADAPFKPNLKTPCVCGKGRGLDDSTATETKGHTVYCQNFMRACDSLNKKSRIQHMTNNLQRGVVHLAEYEANKRIRAQQRRQIIEEIEARELTFSPQINHKSLKLVEKMERERRRKTELSRADDLLSSPTADDKDARRREREVATALKKMEPSAIPKALQHRLPGHEQETFKPKINPRSKVINRDDGRDVYNRLYASATESIMARKTVVNDYTRQYINTNVDQDGGIDLGVAFHTDLEKTAQPKSAKKASVSPSDPNYFNTIAYKPSHAFILRRFLA